MEIYGQVFLKGTTLDGQGDPFLTKNATTDEVGSTANSLGTLQSAHIFVGNASNIPTDVAVTGDISITNAGVTSIGAGVIVNADINASAAIAYSKLALTGAIVNADISNSAAIAYSKLNLTGTIVNGDINASAAIARTKLASGSNYRVIVNSGTGVMTDNGAITGNRALVSDANGLPVHATTTSTEIGYISGVTSAVQTQLNAKLQPVITGAAEGDILVYNGTNYVNLARGTNGQALYSTATSIQWDTPTINGIPIGGTIGQALVKLSGTDFDADWETLTVASIPEITATAAELNILDGATLTVTELNYVDGVTSSIQNQLDGKQSSTLPQNSIWVGNGSNLASAVAAGTNGYVLTVTGGVPSWQPASGGGTPPGSNTEVVFNDGGAFGADPGMVYDKTNNALTINTTRIHSASTDNIFVGGSSGNFTTTGNSNVAVGTNSMSAITSATDNTGVGYNALQDVTIASRNTAIGAFAGANITSAQFNTLVGYSAGIAITSNPGYNVAVGYESLSSLSSGIGNVAIGRDALGDVTGNNNTALGYQAGNNITTGTNNLILGYDIDAPSATANGQLSIQNIIFGTGNTATGTSISTGNIGIAIATPSARLHLPAGTATASTAPLKLTSGTAMATPEDGAIEYHTSHLYFTIGSTRYQLDQQGGITGLTTNRIPYATSSTTIGDDSALTWDATNNAITINSCRIHSTGSSNTFIGDSAGNFTTSGAGGNTIIGSSAGSSLTTANNSVFIGLGAGTNTSSGSLNVAIGSNTMVSNTTGAANTAVGASSLSLLSSGINNIAIGRQAADNITSGGNNIIIGTDIDAQSATASNQLSIQNIIFGTGNSATGTTVSTGSIGIGETAPTRKLEVAGSLAIKAGTSTGQIARVPGIINTSTTTTGNVGTGEDTIYSYTVPANVLSTNKDTLVGNIFGTLAANTNGKRFRLKFGATTIIDENLSFGAGLAGRWDIDFRIVRTGAATQKCYATLRTSTTGNTYFSYYTTAAETLSGTVILTLTGEATADNDIVGESWNVKWEPSE